MGRISINGVFRQCTDEYPELLDYLKDKYPMFVWKQNEKNENVWYSFGFNGFGVQVSLVECLEKAFGYDKESILIRINSDNSSAYFGYSQLYKEKYINEGMDELFEFINFEYKDEQLSLF